MKIVFITNMMNHHQKPVADYLYQKFGDNYHFVTTMPIPKKFLNVGYKNNDDCPYIIPLYEEKNKMLVEQMVVDADVVIMGGIFTLRLSLIYVLKQEDFYCSIRSVGTNAVALIWLFL